MSRRGVSQRRAVPPDSVYNSRLISMMMRRIMRHGKKSIAARIVYDALKTIEERIDTLIRYCQAITQPTEAQESK